MSEILRARLTAGALTAALEATPDRLARLVEGIEAAALDAAPPGEWSTRTVMAHLRDDEFMVMRLRLERMVAEQSPVLTPFDEQAWAASRWLDRDERAQLLEDFRLQRDAATAILRRMPPGHWQRLGSQPEIGTFDLQWWVEHWVEHDVNHLEQIAALLGRPVPA
ncbi:MAG: DinB family protein [Chloroflexi bacterium]|nr:DinB family protein [Chloroflexota bacterium]MDA1240697.1 DinB family protein [Chloroflexota bacterium]